MKRITLIESTDEELFQELRQRLSRKLRAGKPDEVVALSDRLADLLLVIAAWATVVKESQETRKVHGNVRRTKII